VTNESYDSILVDTGNHICFKSLSDNREWRHRWNAERQVVPESRRWHQKPETLDRSTNTISFTTLTWCRPGHLSDEKILPTIVDQTVDD